MARAYGIVGPDPSAGRLALANADPWTIFVRHLKADRRNPASVGHHHRSPCEPVAIVDDSVRITLALDVRQMRSDQATPPLRPRPNAQSTRNLAAERGCS